MFVFVVPLKSKAISTNWETASKLCIASIRSMLTDDTNNQVRVVLACHEPPDGLPNDQRILVKVIEGPIPATKHEMMEDKYRKIRQGLIVARQFAPIWVMRADADDLLSHKLAAFVLAQETRTAWYVQHGWAHKAGALWVMRLSDFHLICGTSCVTWMTEAEFPKDMSESAGDFYLLTQGHHVIVDYLQAQGRPAQPLPFPGVVYTVGSGENWSGTGNWLSQRLRSRQILNCRPVTPAMRREFGLA